MAFREIPGRKQRNTQFPRAWGTFGEKTCLPQKFLPEIAQFFYICVLADRTPRGGKSQNRGFLGPFGLGQPLGTQRNCGPKPEKRNFPELGAHLGENPVRPKSFSPQLCNFFTFCVFADRTPMGGEKTQTALLRPKRDKQTPFSSVLIPSLD